MTKQPKISEAFADDDGPLDLDTLIAAEDAEEAEEAEEAEPRIVRPGDSVHVLASGLSISTSAEGHSGGGAILERGQTFVVTQALIDAARDRRGNRGWVGLVHDPDAQRRRWGRVILAPGPWPADESRWVYGDSSWEEARETARRAAWAEPDPAERARRLAALEAEFGPGAITSKTTNRAPR